MGAVRAPLPRVGCPRAPGQEQGDRTAVSARLALLFAAVQGCGCLGEEEPPAGFHRVQGGDLADSSERCVRGRGPVPPVILDFSGPDLSEPVDVYSDWIDACEAANQ